MKSREGTGVEKKSGLGEKLVTLRRAILVITLPENLNRMAPTMQNFSVSVSSDNRSIFFFFCWDPIASFFQLSWVRKDLVMEFL